LGCIGSKRADSSAPQFPAVPSVVDSNRLRAVDDSAATNTSRNDQNGGIIQVSNVLLITFSELPSGSKLPAFDQQVKDDGTVTLIYNSVFHAAGKKTGDLEKEIRDFYVPGGFPNLTVTVRLTCQCSFVCVDGGFRNPGRYSWTNGMRLNDAIEAAGGFTELSNHRIKVIHPDGATESLRLRVDWVRTNNPALNPGDRVHNPRELL